MNHLLMWSLILLGLSTQTKAYPIIAEQEKSSPRQYLGASFSYSGKSSCSIIASVLNDGVSKHIQDSTQKIFASRSKLLFECSNGKISLSAYFPQTLGRDIFTLYTNHLDAAKNEVKSEYKYHTDKADKSHYRKLSIAHQLARFTTRLLQNQVYSPITGRPTAKDLLADIEFIQSQIPLVVTSIGPLSTKKIVGLVTGFWKPRPMPVDQKKKTGNPEPTKVKHEAYILAANDSHSHLLFVKLLTSNNEVDPKQIESYLDSIANGPASIMIRELRQRRRLIYSLSAEFRSKSSAIIIQTHAKTEKINEVINVIDDLLTNYVPSERDQLIANGMAFDRTSLAQEFPPNRANLARLDFLKHGKTDFPTIEKSPRPLLTKIQLSTIAKSLKNSRKNVILVSGRRKALERILTNRGIRKQNISYIISNN